MARLGVGAAEEVEEHCTVPDQLVVDKELEFRVKVGKTDTEGGPVPGREHREEVMDRRTVSTTHRHATKSTWVWKHTTHKVREKTQRQSGKT